MTIAIVLVLLVLGSLIFHYLSPLYFTPIASNWKGMDETIELTFWMELNFDRPAQALSEPRL